MTPRRFRVAFSFAGAKRAFVAETSSRLAQPFGQAKILYDKYHEAEFARGDLGIYLPELYHEQADLVVVVICPDYEGKEWCGLEWTAIHDLLKQRRHEEVMLANFAHASVKGLYGTAGYVNLDHHTPETFTALIVERLKLNDAASKGHDVMTVPPPAATLSTAAPSSLPRLHSFFGREKELKSIADALSPKARTWGALIDGPGGMGKTTLAIRAAELATPGQFKHIIFLSAKEREMTADGQRALTGFVLPSFLQMLNEMADKIRRPELARLAEEERIAKLHDALTTESALLLLDNLESLTAEHRDQVFTFLSRLPPGCKAIVTSRRRSDTDARIIRLDRLGKEAALLLLAELAADRPLLLKATIPERETLYEETGGNPLLMRWVAGQLGKGRCKTVSKALEFIRSAPADNNPLEFIFGDLLETFSPAETKVLCALTYFTISVETKLIAELAGIARAAAQTALEDLTNRALVMPDDEDKQFALVPMVADFLRKKRPEVVTETGNRLEKRAFALIVENGFEKHDRYPNLDAVWSTVAPAYPIFLAGRNTRLQSVCAALQKFLHFTGRWDECLAFNLQAEAKAEASGDHGNAGWRAYHACCIYDLRQQGDKLLACARRVARHWDMAQAGARERAIAISLLGDGYRLKEDYQAAIAAYRQALEIDRTLAPESADVASDLNDLAGVERFDKDFKMAEKDYQEALRIARVVGDTEGLATYTGNLAALALDRKDWQVAEVVAQEALIMAGKLGRKESIASNNSRIAQALWRQGRKAEALPHAQQAVELLTQLGHPDLAKAQAILQECQP